MKLLFQYPHKKLLPYVNRYVNFETDEVQKINILPNGNTYLTYSYYNKAIFSLSREKTPEFFVSGIVTTHKLFFETTGGTGHFGVEFKPGGLHYLTGLSLYQLQNNLADFTQLFQDEHDYMRLMSETTAFRERCCITNEFLLKKEQQAAHDHLIEQALNEIQCAGKNFSVGHFARQANISERHFRRKFKRIVGVSPKVFSRIHQVKCMVKAIDKGKSNLNEVYYDCHFFDTPHSIRTFQELMGMNPGKFIESYNEFLGFYLAETELAKR